MESDGIFELHPVGTLYQGDLISGLPVDRYDPTRTMSIIITAKCDLVQDNTSLLTYLPVVPVGDWYDIAGWPSIWQSFTVEGKQVISNMLPKEKKSSVDQIVLAAKLYGADEALRLAESISQNKLKQRQTEAVRWLAFAFAKLQSRRDVFPPSTSLPKSIRSKLNSLCERINSGRSADLFFLPKVPHADDISGGHLVLLRHVSTTRLGDGGAGMRRIAERGTARIGRLRSPYIELLMQRFSLLFSRVGVPDAGRLATETLTRREEKSIQDMLEKIV